MWRYFQDLFPILVLSNLSNISFVDSILHECLLNISSFLAESKILMSTELSVYLFICYLQKMNWQTGILGDAISDA